VSLATDAKTAERSTQMISVIAYVRLKPGSIAHALACYGELIPQIMAHEPGCLEYAPMLDCDAGLPNQEKDADTIIVSERWNCLEDFRKHIAMPHSADFRARIADYLREGITVRIMRSTGGAH
jgi:quinol monooxygenase YgiN